MKSPKLGDIFLIGILLILIFITVATLIVAIYIPEFSGVGIALVLITFILGVIVKDEIC